MTEVSVVIPAFNNAATIGAAIDSVLAQGIDGLELIVADHASTDHTLEALEPYLQVPGFRLIHTESGGGAARNWNRVTRAATGEFIKLVCGDDILYPGALALQVQTLRSAPSAVAVGGRRDILDARGGVLLAGRGLGSLVGTHDGRAAIAESVRAGTNLFGEPACVLMRREALRECGDWDPRYAYMIDQASYSRVLLTGDFVGLDRVVAGFRLNAGQWSAALARQQAAQAIEFHHRFDEEHPGVLSSADLRLGDARARIVAMMRRSAYVVFRRRLRLPASEWPA